MLCQEWSLVKRFHPDLKVIPLYCHCWTCPTCRPHRTTRLISEATRGIPLIFITLTSRYRSGHSPAAAARDLVDAWRKVRAEYLKLHGRGSLPFLAVFEATKKGWPHLHIVARARWINQRWLSRRMTALIGAPIVWVERIDSIRKIANYVAKYIGKNPHRFAGTKRYWRSLDYLNHDHDPTEGADSPAEPWQIVHMPFGAYIAQAMWLGFDVEFGKGEALLSLRKPP